MKKTTRVTGVDGKRIELITDDTYTLRFGHGVEATASSLRRLVCQKSLERISKTSSDENERAKARLALTPSVW